MNNTNGKRSNSITTSFAISLNDKMAEKIGLSSVSEIKKGALITLPWQSWGMHNYKILAVNGTQIKVMAMEDVYSSPFSETSHPVYYDKGPDCAGQDYFNSTIDNKINQFYRNLPECIRYAIVPQDISQSMYLYQEKDKFNPNVIVQQHNTSTTPDNNNSGPNNQSFTRINENYVGKRHVCIMDVDDIIEYLDGKFDTKSVNELFFKDDVKFASCVWLRSTVAHNMNRALFVEFKGTLDFDNVRRSNGVRPVFVLDLAKFLPNNT